MGRIITIDPVTRLEGHLKLKANLDDDGRVTSSYMTMSRGAMLQPDYLSSLPAAWLIFPPMYPNSQMNRANSVDSSRQQTKSLFSIAR